MTRSTGKPLPAAAVLSRNYLFRDLPARTIESIAALASTRNLDKGGVLFAQGDEGDALFGVASGRVLISATAPNGREKFLSIMEPGDTFGEIAVMDGLPRTAGATALEDARLIVIKRRDFIGLLEQEPKLAIHLLQLLCKRLRWTSELVEESAFLSGAARLAKRLLTLASMHGRRPATPSQLELRISQDELAHFSGISRQNVNHHLREWQKQGWVELRRGRIGIRDAAALSEVIRSGEDAVD